MMSHTEGQCVLISSSLFTSCSSHTFMYVDVNLPEDDQDLTKETTVVWGRSCRISTKLSPNTISRKQLPFVAEGDELN